MIDQSSLSQGYLNRMEVAVQGWRGDHAQSPEVLELCVFGDMYRVRSLFWVC